MPRTRNPAIRSALVLGSTSAVAQAICEELARRGCTRFHLMARNPEGNELIASDLRDRHGAEVSTETMDLLRLPPSIPAADPALEATAVKFPAIVEHFDLYLVTAGSLGDAERARTDGAEAQAITAANYTGLLPWLTAICSEERLARPGRLWVFSSVAADRGRPSNYHYGAAKAALTVFCEGLMLRCHGKPFAIRILKAGFMATPMTIGKAPPALCASPISVARDLLRRPDQRGIEYIPWFWWPIMTLVRLLPPSLAHKL